MGVGKGEEVKRNKAKQLPGPIIEQKTKVHVVRKNVLPFICCFILSLKNKSTSRSYNVRG